MKVYKNYNIPEKSDLKKEGIVVPMGSSLMVMINDNTLFDTGINVTDVYNMSDKEFIDILYDRVVSYVEGTR